MKNQDRFLDFVGAWLGVFDVDWNSDFDSDGYTDLLGIEPLNEPLVYGDTPAAPPRTNTIAIKRTKHKAL